MSSYIGAVTFVGHQQKGCCLAAVLGPVAGRTKCLMDPRHNTTTHICLHQQELYCDMSTCAWLKHAIHHRRLAILMMPGTSADNMTATTIQATMSCHQKQHLPEIV